MIDCMSLFHSNRVFFGCFVVPNVILGPTSAASTMMQLSEGAAASKPLPWLGKSSHHSFDTRGRGVPTQFVHWTCRSAISEGASMDVVVVAAMALISPLLSSSLHLLLALKPSESQLLIHEE